MANKKLKYSEGFIKLDFSSDTMKKAYLSACKWYANNILTNDKLKDLQVSYEKLTDKSKPTVIMYLYVTTDVSFVKQQHCDICKETSKLFYFNENVDCNWCKINGYISRATSILDNKVIAFKDIVKGVL